MQVELKEDGTAEANLSGEKVSGNWIPFYDQAFKVSLSNGMKFITNYRYSVKEYVTSTPLEKGAKALKDLATDDYDKFYSQCDRTMIGFV